MEVGVEPKVAESAEGPISYYNWHAYESGKPVNSGYEFPLYTDAHVKSDRPAGMEPYELINTGAVGTPGRASPAIVLRAFLHLEPDSIATREISSTITAGYHGGGLPDEMAALGSLLMGIRLMPGAPNREFRDGGDKRGKPIQYPGGQAPVLIDSGTRPVVPALLAGNLAHCSNLYTFKLLRPEDANVLIRAARLYQQAMWLADSQTSMAWLLLVSAIETAAVHWFTGDEPNIDMLRTVKPEMHDAIASTGNQPLLQMLADEIAPGLKVTKKFLDFFKSHLAPEPDRRPEDETLQISFSKGKMGQALSKVYDYRSKALHAGIPFPSPMCWAPMCINEGMIPEERPFGTASSGGGGQWLHTDTPMLFHMFEYLSRHALIQWWKEDLLKRSPFVSSPPSPEEK